MKLCSRCKIEKHESGFYLDKRRNALRAACKACCKLYQVTSGRDLHLIAVQRYQKTPSARRMALVRVKRYNQTPKGRIASRQRDRRKRELKTKLDFQFSREHVQCVYDRFHDQCFNCGSVDRLEIDHHYPLNRGFGLSLSNAVLLCKTCNSSKHDKMPEDFYTSDQLTVLSSILSI